MKDTWELLALHFSAFRFFSTFLKLSPWQNHIHSFVGQTFQCSLRTHSLNPFENICISKSLTTWEIFADMARQTKDNMQNSYFGDDRLLFKFGEPILIDVSASRSQSFSVFKLRNYIFTFYLIYNEIYFWSFLD